MLRFDIGDNSGNINSCRQCPHSYQLRITLTIILSPHINFIFAAYFQRYRNHQFFYKGETRKSIPVGSCSSYHKTSLRRQFYSCILQSPSVTISCLNLKSASLQSDCKLNQDDNFVVVWHKYFPKSRCGSFYIFSFS